MVYLIFFEYELELRRKTKNNELKINWEEYNSSKKDHSSIEHILPQNSNNQCWIKKLRKFKKPNYIIHSLGNLVPLSVLKNSKLQNDCFDEKKKGYKNGSYSE